MILSSLIKFALPFQAVVFLRDVLSQRSQRVSFNNSGSDWSAVTSGVPQGSVIGPVLFALVIDSLHPVCSNSVIIKYADDVTLLHCIREVGDDKLHDELSHLEQWSSANGLFLNFDKCFVMNCVTKNSLSLKPVCSSAGITLKTVLSIRLHGVISLTN